MLKDAKNNDPMADSAKDHYIIVKQMPDEESQEKMLRLSDKRNDSEKFEKVGRSHAQYVQSIH